MEESKDNVQRPFKGMVTDVSPSDQPKETYRYALNAVNKTEVGDTNFLSMEKAISECTSFPMGTTVLASIYMVDDLFAVFLSDGVYDYIGTVNKMSVFKLYVKTQVLDFSSQHQINGTFRIRRNSSKVIYWVDGFNKPRLFNFDRPFDFYSTGYITFLETHTVNDVYNLEKWSDIKFDLIKTYTSIPTFVKAEILNTGSIPSGSYSIAIQLVDENLSPTEWITTSNPVNIFVDSLDLEYAKIRGSRNSNSDSQNFQNASKSIQWTLGNLDQNFSFYRIAVLVSNAGNGSVNKALVSNLSPINDTTFVYSGNDGDFTTTPLSDIEKNKTDISSAKYIEQLENRMILAGIKGKQIDWCDFQANASKIKSNLSVNYNVSIDNIESEGSPKNPVSSFTLTGYMWGEVYSFGIVYIFKDGYKSPVYHIPGRPSVLDSQGNETIVNGMDYYECGDTVYPAIHSCSGNYWGVDGYAGSQVNLLGKKIRHHKFPKRTTKLYKEVENQISQGTVDDFSIEVVFAEGGEAIGIPGYITATDATGNVVGSTYISAIPQGNQTFDGGRYNSSLGVTVSFGLDDTQGQIVPLYTVNVTKTVTDSFISVKNNTTDLCGIRFSNIERPHPDVVGFEIVRNERTDDDKIIVDNVLVGAITCEGNANNPYQTFGLLAPDVTDSRKSKSGVYIFSPEHQFKNKKLIFDEFDIVGVYDRVAKYVPLKTDGESGNGVYIQDVRPGTTFNSSYNKGEDPDGFDLQILYRSNEMLYSLTNDIVLPKKDRLLYLSAAGNMSIDSDIFFNASIDNKIMVATFDGENQLPANLFTKNGSPRLLYGSLIKNNTTAYSNFINKTYYAETNNPVMFGNNTITDSGNIFNGDAYVAPITINSSTYYDTKFGGNNGWSKKSRVWKIILGSVLAVAGIVLMLIPGTQIGGAALIETAITTMAIAYGVSMLTSGIEFETMKNMVDQHYEAGLKDTIKDVDNTDINYNDGTKPDDKILWFVDRLQNIYFESSINIGLRCGMTVSVSDFVDSPSVQPSDKAYNTSATASKESYEVYLANKFTVVDREQNSGRLYTGYAMAEFYDINIDYMRKNHEKPNYYLPIEYDCCSVKIENFNNRVFYSEQSFQEEKLDNYRSFLTNNYKDVEGQFGEITGIFRFNNTLYIHTTESLLVLPQNMQERINQELVTFIGTGEFFAITPRKIMDGENGSFGSSDNRATVITKNGVFFVNSVEGVPYLLGQTPKDIGTGMSIWFKNNLKIKLHDYIKAIPYETYNGTTVKFAEEVYEPSENSSVGVHAVYDSILNRIIVTKIDYVPLFTINVYGSGVTPQGKIRYNPLNNKFYVGSILGEREILLSDKNYFENKSWTMSFSLDTQSWVSYHSYIPSIYISTPSGLYSAVGSKLYKHHTEGLFCIFYGTKYQHIIEYVSVSNPLATRIWDDLTLLVSGKKYVQSFQGYVDSPYSFFDKIVLSNSRQCSGEMNMVVKDVNNSTLNYLLNQVQNVQATITADKNEHNWSINHLRDYISDYTQPMFLSRWIDVRNVYPIDKVVNQAVINQSKAWFELESFRDKYLVIRLIFSNFGDSNVQLTTNYSIENEQQSLR